jgi:hypothetical protein
VIPATQNAVNLVDRLLRESLSEYESTSTVAKSNLAPQPVNISDDWCSQSNDEGFNCTPGTCWRDSDMELCEDPEGNIFMPEAEVVAEIEDCIGDHCGGGAPLPWPPPPPAEDPSEPDPWEPIIPDGGSSDPCESCDPGGNPDDDEETCQLGQIDDGFGNCIDEEGDPEPCETNDEVIDHLGEVGTFQQLWEQSNTTLDIEDRTERGGWIIETSQGLQFQPFHKEGENWEYTACGINPPNSFIVPENSIGWIHTHPFYPGEDTTPVCGEEGEEEYDPGLSGPDYWFMMTIIEATNNFSFTSYLIDGGKISSMDMMGLESENSFEPCGYNP